MHKTVQSSKQSIHPLQKKCDKIQASYSDVLHLSYINSITDKNYVNQSCVSSFKFYVKSVKDATTFTLKNEVV